VSVSVCVVKMVVELSSYYSMFSVSSSSTVKSRYSHRHTHTYTQRPLISICCSHTPSNLDPNFKGQVNPSFPSHFVFVLMFYGDDWKLIVLVEFDGFCWNSNSCGFEKEKKRERMLYFKIFETFLLLRERNRKWVMLDGESLV